MYFKSVSRTNPETGNFEGYYRLVESYRNSSGRVCHRTLLNIGYLPEYTPEHLNKTRALLVYRCRKQPTIFNETDDMVLELADKLWYRLISEKRIDVAESSQLIKEETIEHKDVREIGSEWLTYNVWKQLGISSFLESLGWDKEAIKLAATQIISRAVYPASEHRTSNWIKENSALCNLTGYDVNKMTKDKLYGSSLRLYSIKDELEQHLSNRTNDLFNIDDKIILFDLTNTYFEGRKVASKIAKHGRSKEKRKDAKLVVLAMVVNIFGFVKYTSIYEGNMADNKTLEAMIDKLAGHTIPSSHTPTVVIDESLRFAQ